MFKSSNQQQMLHSNYSRRCVKTLLLFWNDKPVESMVLVKAFMRHQEQRNCIYSYQKIVLVCHQITLMLNATLLFLVRAPVAKFRNKKFTAKGIINDVTLFQSATFKNGQSKGFTFIVSFSMTWRRIGWTNKRNFNN